MLEKLALLQLAWDEIETVFQSPTSWEVKFSLIFKHYNDVVRPLLEDLGTPLEYCDPDTTYEEDVSALVHAGRRLIESLSHVAPDRQPTH